MEFHYERERPGEKGQQNNQPENSAWNSFVDNLHYAAVQAPLQSLNQVTGSVVDVNLVEKPSQASFGTGHWHASQLGNAAGALPWFLGARFVARGAAKLIARPCAVAEASATGALFGGLLEPVPDSADAWTHRRNNAFGTGLTFGAMGAAGRRIDSGLRGGAASQFSNRAVSDLHAAIKDRARGAVSLGLAGLAASPIDPLYKSVMIDHRLPTMAELGRAAYEFGFVGATLGALIPAHRSSGAAHEAVPSRAIPDAAPAQSGQTAKSRANVRLRFEELEPRNVYSATAPADLVLSDLSHSAPLVDRVATTHGEPVGGSNAVRSSTGSVDLRSAEPSRAAPSESGKSTVLDKTAEQSRAEADFEEQVEEVMAEIEKQRSEKAAESAAESQETEPARLEDKQESGTEAPEAPELAERPNGESSVETPEPREVGEKDASAQELLEELLDEAGFELRLDKPKALGHSEAAERESRSTEKAEDKSISGGQEGPHKESSPSGNHQQHGATNEHSDRRETRTTSASTGLHH